MGYSPLGRKELDTAEVPDFSHNTLPQPSTTRHKNKEKSAKETKKQDQRGRRLHTDSI